MDKIGIEVSANNGPVNWDLLKLDSLSIKFAFIKTSQGSNHPDPNRFLNAYGASHVGIQFGYYHSTSFNSEALTEAKAFRNIIKEMPISSLPVVLHIRTDEITMPADHVMLWISTFVMDMINNGYPKIMLHSYPYFLNTHLPGTHPFGHLPLWMSQYSKGFNVPRGWDKIKIWQYTSKGSVMGISTDVCLCRADDLSF